MKTRLSLALALLLPVACMAQTTAVTIAPSQTTTGLGVVNTAVQGTPITVYQFASGTELLWGTAPYIDTGIAQEMNGNLNSYYQLIIQNRNSGVAASADIIVGNSNTTATTWYGDFGINSPNFSGTGSLNLPNAVYLYSQTGDLVIGTTVANTIHFVTNSASTDAMYIDSSGVVHFTQTPTGVGGGSPGGSSGTLQYNNAGSFGGATGVTWNGTVAGLFDLQNNNQVISGINATNQSSGTAAAAINEEQGISLGFIQEMTGSGFTGTVLTGGASGIQADLYTNGAAPLSVGTNNVASFTIGGSTPTTTFIPTSSYAAINVGSYAGNPATLNNGDLWYNTTSNGLSARVNGNNIAVEGTTANQTSGQALVSAGGFLLTSYTGFTVNSSGNISPTPGTSSSNSAYLVPFFAATTAGTQGVLDTNTGLSFNPSTGALTATSVQNTPIGSTTPSTGAFTTLKSTTWAGTVYAGGTTSASTTITWTNGSIQNFTLGANTTFTFSGAVAGTTIYVNVTQAAGGGDTVTWPADPGTIMWTGGAAPTMTSTASHKDIYTIYYDGSLYYGSYVQNFY